MPMTAAHHRNDSITSTGFVGSGFRWLGGVAVRLVAARELQMRPRVRSVLESLDRETLAAHGLERPTPGKRGSIAR